MSDDRLGTSWGQCRCMVQYCFTSTETIRLVRTDSPGPTLRASFSGTFLLMKDVVNQCLEFAQDGHLDSHTVPELCEFTQLLSCARLGTGKSPVGLLWWDIFTGRLGADLSCEDWRVHRDGVTESAAEDSETLSLSTRHRGRCAIHANFKQRFTTSFLQLLS